MERKTIKQEGGDVREYRYFISSLSPDIPLASRAVRGHLAVESMHWHLDVTFKEDANTTLFEYYSQMASEHSKVAGNQWQENVTKEKKGFISACAQ